MSDELIGKVIGGYEIQSVIGYGGMATVYRAEQVSMKRVVAMKVLPSQFVNDDTYIQRFNREVEIVSKLEHRNIVPVYDYGQFNGQPYIVMRYMSGGSVDDLLAHGPLDQEKALSIIQQIAPALDYAHSKDILHRDLKPSNILMDDDGGAYLTDFGIARIIGQKPGATITTQGVVGTPSYMSPEQAQGHPLDGRSDIYALGITLFEMVTGRRPFQSDTPYSIAVMQVTTPPPSPRSFNPAISIAVEQVIYRSLKKKPDERYASGVVLAEALKRAFDPPSTSIHDTQPGIPKPTAPNPVQRQAPAPQPPPPQPQAVPPPPRYPTAAPQPSRPPTSAEVRVPPRRGRQRQQGNLWMSAAVGGLIGCGLLTIVVIIVAIIVSSVQAAPNGNDAPSANTLAPVTDAPVIVPTLAATPTQFLSITSQPPPTLPPTSAPIFDETGAQVTPTIIPVGVRDP